MLAKVRTSQGFNIFFLSFLFRLFLTSQQSLLKQQERVEERVQEIEEQLCKLDSDKCVVEVCFCTPVCGRKRSYTQYQNVYTA